MLMETTKFIFTDEIIEKCIDKVEYESERVELEYDGSKRSVEHEYQYDDDTLIYINMTFWVTHYYRRKERYTEYGWEPAEESLNVSAKIDSINVMMWSEEEQEYVDVDSNINEYKDTLKEVLDYEF